MLNGIEGRYPLWQNSGRNIWSVSRERPPNVGFTGQQKEKYAVKPSTVVKEQISK